MARAAWVVVVLVAAGGCTSAAARSRRADLYDVFHVELQGATVGAAVNVGPAILGFHGSGGHPDGVHWRLGITGAGSSTSSGPYAGLVAPFTWADVRYGERRPGWEEKNLADPPPYRNQHPTLGSIGFEVSLLIGVGARFDVVELVDFVAGLFGADPVGDDYREPPPEEPPPVRISAMRAADSSSPGGTGTFTSCSAGP